MKLFPPLRIDWLDVVLILILVAASRELLSRGSLLDFELLPLIGNGGWYEGNELMLLAPSAFFIIGLIIWGIRSCWQEQIEEDEFPESHRDQPEAG